MKKIDKLIDRVPGATLEEQFELIRESWEEVNDFMELTEITRN
jgi:hypothetical protein